MPSIRPPVTVTPTPASAMRRAPILPLLFALVLASCGGSDDRSGGYGLSRSSQDAPTEEQAVISLEEAQMPPTAPASGSAARPYARQAPPTIVTPEVSAADTLPIAPPPQPGQPAATLNPMLIRTGTATVQVDSLEQGIAAVRALAQRVGGIVGNTTINSGAETVRSAVVELRIPSASFDRAVTGLAPIGRVEQVNVTAEDVGEEFTDVTARVANARRLEARLLDLLDRRTGRLEEVLNLERELARVREEIERYDGRLRYLRTRTSVSVLTVTLHEPHQIIGRPGDRPIRDAFGAAWRNFVELVAGAIAASGILIPLALLAYAAWRVLRRLRRRERERDAAYREALRRERERTAASASAGEEPAARG
jgi:hypothetical protein